MRSAPRRTSSAGRPRRALGTDPAVPANITESSIAAEGSATGRRARPTKLDRVSLREVDGSPGAPWERGLAGSLDRIVVHSELLEGNPLGDPAVRPLYVYRAPGVEVGSGRAVPSVYLLQGFFGQVDQWLARTSGGPTTIERIDATFARGDCPPAIVVLVDAWTSRGGSQFLNSTSTGRYLDHVCD